MQAKQKCAIGIDVGGTSIKAGLISERGEVLYWADECPCEGDNVEGFVGLIAELVAPLMEEAERKGFSVAAIGVGLPGLIEGGVIIGAIPNLPALEGADIQKLLGEKLGCDVAVHNDAFLMSFAEHEQGAGKNVANVVFLTIGTGIGSSIKLGNEFFFGARGRGAEVGHMVFYPQAENTMLEEYASTNALVEKYEELSGKKADGKEIVKQYQEDNSHARAAMEFHFCHLGAAIGSLANLLNPQRFVLGGGITQAGEFYMESLIQYVKKYAVPISLEKTDIVSAQFGNQGGAIGAALFALSKKS
ncbi:MAG: ROK family protein [Parvibaculales bacterium]